MSGIEFWSEDRREQVVAMWRDGKSASVIAKELGLTRNAVLGKLHRLRGQLGRREVASRVSKPAVKVPKRQRSRPAPPHPLKVVTHEPVELGPVLEPRELEPPANASPDSYEFIGPPALFLNGGITILELTNDTCRWPGADRPWRFCGALVDEGSRYCTVHRARARQ